MSETLADQKARLDYEHRLELKRIWLDKFLLALLIVLAGIVGNYVLEGYKSDLVKAQFLLDKRLEALKDIRMSFSKLTQHAYEESADAPSASPAAYLSEVITFIHTGNKWGFLFSDKFSDDLNHYLLIHHAAAGPSLKLTRDHTRFLAEITAAFDNTTRVALTTEVLGIPVPATTPHFQIHRVPPNLIAGTNSDTFFDKNFEKWKKENP